MFINHSAIRLLYRHEVSNERVSCKATGGRNRLGAYVKGGINLSIMRFQSAYYYSFKVLFLIRSPGIKSECQTILTGIKPEALRFG